MKSGLACFLLACTCAVAQAAAPGNFYLVSGPSLAGDRPAAFSATFKGDLEVPRGISAVLANVEGFDGRWSDETTGKRRMQNAPVPPQPELVAAWDSVYGPGFFRSHVLGAPFFERAVIKGSKGTTLQVEIYRGSHDGYTDPKSGAPLNVQGVAQDDKGNIYKVVF